VWFFCGTTDDYHQEGDVAAKATSPKMEKVPSSSSWSPDIAGKPALLALDLHPESRRAARRI